jgi:hypothetical protein
MANITLRFARRPLGGSLVIFTPPWSTDVGKYLVGIDVSLRTAWDAEVRSDWRIEARRVYG